MPLEAATYISQLVSTNPAHTDGLNQADSHIRLVKSTLQATLPNLAGPVTGTQAQLNAAATAFATAGTTLVPANGTTGGSLVLQHGTGAGDMVVWNDATSGQGGGLAVTGYDATNANPLVSLTLTRAGALAATTSLNAPSIQKSGAELVPTGIICMWSGSVASVPAGWHLCDGTSGTPDLRNRFIVGAGSTYSPAATGGATSQTVATAGGGAHAHGGATANAGGHTHTGTTDTQGLHDHGGSTGGYALQVSDLPAHTHEQNVASGSAGSLPWLGTGGGTGVGDAGFATNATGGNAAHFHAISGAGSHAHNLSVNAVGDHAHGITSDPGHTHSVTVPTLPPYYALAYVMKL